MERASRHGDAQDHEWVRRPAGSRSCLLVDLAIVTVITTISLVVILRLWEAYLRVPFGYAGDGLYYARDAKSIVQTGWVQTNARLGAPFGQQLYDFPVSPDNGNYVMMRAIAVVTNDWAILLNVFFLLTFYTAAWSAYLCLRWLRAGRTSAVVSAVLFAFAPYHLARGAAHLMLSSYWVVPVAVLLAVRAAAGVPLIARRVRSDPTASSRRPALRDQLVATLPWVALCICCGSFGAYYTFFALISVAVSATLVAAAQRTIRPLLTALSYCAVMAGTFALNILPNLIHRARDGVNPLALNRKPIEFDIYGLRLIQLVTPVPGHWLGFLRSVSSELMKGYSSEPSQFFGLVGAVALLAMLGWFVTLALRSGGDRRDDLRRLLAVVTLVWILIATTGGLNWLLVLIGFIDLRAWDRVSILLLFASLTWLALTVGPVVRRWVGTSGRRSRAALGAAALVLVFGLADQGSARFVTDTSINGPTFSNERQFFGRVEASLPTGAMVYQLPYRRFPEEPPVYGSGDYDLYRPFLQTENLRFSYGGMKGREAEWQQRLVNASPYELTKAVVAVGFDAFVIHRIGYKDHAVELEAGISAVTGRPPLVSPDRRWSFFDLTGLRATFGTESELEALRTSLLATARNRLDAGGR